MPNPKFTEADARKLIKLVRHHGSISAASRATGIPRQTIQSNLRVARAMMPDAIPEAASNSNWAMSPARRKKAAEAQVEGEKAAVAQAVIEREARAKTASMPEDLPDRIAEALRGKRVSSDQLAERLDQTSAHIEKAFSMLLSRGMRIIERNGIWQFDQSPVQPAYIAGAAHTVVSRPDNTFVFGACGDQHYASKYSRHEVTEALYDIYAEDGVQCVFNTGNWIDGEARFNVHDLTVHGMDAQCRHLASVYPKRKGISTYAVAGDDHEGWFSQREGVDIGRYAERCFQDVGRTDWVNLGYMEAPIRLVNANSGKEAILSVVHPGGGCFDKDADILTRYRGWVNFADLTFDDEVATMNQDTRQFEWQKPTAITNEPYKGTMYRFKARTFDFTVTPDHKLMVKRKQAARLRFKNLIMPNKSRRRIPDDWHVVTAKEIVDNYARQRYALPTVASGRWVGEYTPRVSIPFRPQKTYSSVQIRHFGDVSIEDAAQLIGWYVTKGHAAANEKQITLCQCSVANPENHAKILDLLNRLDIKPTISGRNQKDITISSVELHDWLVAECGRLSANVHLPAWLKNQPLSVLQPLLDVMLSAYGWKCNRSWGYGTISKVLADDVAEIAQKCGFGISMCNNRGGGATVNIRAVQNEPTLNNAPEVIENYDGTIHCCTVPNGMIYVRSRGRAFWSHNSSYALSYTSQKLVESYDGGEKPAALLMGHYHKLWHGNIRNVWVTQTGTSQDQNPFMRKKKLEAHVGGAVVEYRQDPATGALVRCKAELIRYFNRGYYRDRWNPAGDVTMLPRAP